MLGQPQGLGRASRSLTFRISMVPGVQGFADQIHIPNDNDRTYVGPRRVQMIEQG